MTSKKRRQRGSRTHGGGTHKNRRGAGNRGGRGAAGKDKHEFHGTEPAGKHGFTRPDAATRDVREVSVRTLDENAIVYAAEELATPHEDDDGYRIDARDIVEDGHDADVVKLLGNGQVRQPLTVVADAFTDTAVQRLEAAGGEAVLTERGQELVAADDDAETDTTEASQAGT